MSWKKLGLLYSYKSSHPKLITHFANPLPILIQDDVYRIFFSGRDSSNRSSVGAVDIDILNLEVIQEFTEPFFQHGDSESFYSHGVSIGSYYEVDNIKYILFMGWKNSEDKHWYGEIGRLILTSDFQLKIDTNQVFMGLNDVDPFSLSYPWVTKAHNKEYYMWYGSTLTWDAGNDEMLHVIKYATSEDGHNWVRKGLAVPYSVGYAQAFSRPTVITSSQSTYDMWFSYRSGKGEKYRIGYAKSNNKKDWELSLDETGINVSPDGWDSEMIEYPYVFIHKGQRYMLYNGNGYGKSGFGIAVWEQQ